MKKNINSFALFSLTVIAMVMIALSGTIFSCGSGSRTSMSDNTIKNQEGNTAAMKEGAEILVAAAMQMNMSKEDFMKKLVYKNRFTASQNVFFPSTVAIDFTKKLVTLPVYKGIGPSGNPTYYIITEAADYDVAKMMGLNYAPKLANGRGTAGSQQV
ncbi:MAG: DUF7482 domain-containing protein, partial [Chitinophagaceae bacterium]